MAPEIIVPSILEGSEDVEVLKLGEGEEGRCDDDVNTKQFEARMVEEERILDGEEAVLVRMHGAGVFDDIDILWRPAGCDIREDALLEKGPGAREAYE